VWIKSFVFFSFNIFLASSLKAFLQFFDCDKSDGVTMSFYVSVVLFPLLIIFSVFC